MAHRDVRKLGWKVKGRPVEDEMAVTRALCGLCNGREYVRDGTQLAECWGCDGKGWVPRLEYDDLTDETRLGAQDDPIHPR